MTNTHDPYLNTVKRSLTEKKNKIRKEQILEIKETKENQKSFFSRSIVISDYIYLPESLQQFFLLSIFILIPYLFGLLLILMLMGQEAFNEHMNLTFDLYMFTWTVGYETMAFILLLVIFQSAFTCKNKSN